MCARQLVTARVLVLFTAGPRHDTEVLAGGAPASDRRSRDRGLYAVSVLSNTTHRTVLMDTVYRRRTIDPYRSDRVLYSLYYNRLSLTNGVCKLRVRFMWCAELSRLGLEPSVELLDLGPTAVTHVHAHR